MPNGRSGGFVIATADLKELVSAVPDTAIVGRLTTGSRPRTASAAEISRCIEEYPLDRITVEEQDNAFYIIHIRNEPVVWVVVHSESPMFAQLRQRHTQWMVEHPGWNGWIGF